MTPEELERRRERDRAYARKHYSLNRERILALRKARRIAPDLYPSRTRKLTDQERRTKWRLAQRRYRQRYPDRQRANWEKRGLRWREKNPEAYKRIRAHANLRRRARKAGAQCDESRLLVKYLAGLYGAPRMRCQWCGKFTKKSARTADHVVPIARGGGDTVANIVMACRSCNCKKGAKSPAEYGFLHFDYRISPPPTPPSRPEQDRGEGEGEREYPPAPPRGASLLRKV